MRLFLAASAAIINERSGGGRRRVGRNAETKPVRARGEMSASVVGTAITAGTDMLRR